MHAHLDKPGEQRFQRAKYFPTGWELTINEFLSLFHRFAYICKPLDGGAWFSAKEEWRLTDSEILKAVACAHPKYFLGCRAGRATKYAVLDIDAGSKHHNLSEINRLRETLGKAGIKQTCIYRSSISDGWHLYIFFDEPVSSRDLNQQLTSLLRLHNFKVDKGSLEVFPQPGVGSLGNGLRLPLQPGFAWLDQRTLDVEIERQEVSSTKALELFVDDLTNSTNTRHDFHQMKALVEQLLQSKQQIEESTAVVRRPGIVVPIRKVVAPDCLEADREMVESIFEKLPPGINPSDWIRGRRYYDEGLTGPSQRADAIFSISHYLFYGDPQRELEALGYGYHQERQWAIEAILDRKHNGKSKDIEKGRPDAVGQAKRAAEWLPERKRGLEQKPYKKKVSVAWARNSANQKIDARKRIKAAVEEFVDARTTFSVRDLMAKAKCGADTLYKHKDLWKEAQARLQLVLLASDPPEYNVVLGEGSQETLSPAQSHSKNMPPGRLAARRVVYELTLRAQRDSKRKRQVVVSVHDFLNARWQAQLDDLLRSSLKDLDTRTLQTLLSASRRLLSQAPDEESEVSVKSLIIDIGDEIGRRDVQSADTKV